MPSTVETGSDKICGQQLLSSNQAPLKKYSEHKVGRMQEEK
jgi:hypothetical protein